MDISLRKHVLPILCCFVLLCAAPLGVWAIKPITVAVLPPVNTADYRYQDDIQLIQTGMKKPFKYPYYTLLPDAVVQSAVTAYTAAHPGARLTDRHTLTELAASLPADLTIVVELSQIRQDRLSSLWLDDTYVESDIALKCYAYSPLFNRFDNYKAVKYDRESESTADSIPVIFQDLTAQLSAKLPYKRIPAAGLEKPEQPVETKELPD